jgi:beta-carotene 3-hydroxylase
MTIILFIILWLATVAAMEAFAWWAHKYIMHGWGWGWHESHHRPRTGRFEKNDLYAVTFAIPAILLIAMGVHWWWPLLPIGIGITTYGIIYSLFHDGLVHHRYPLPIKAERGYLLHLLQAHHLHHAVHAREGCVSFGFLYAPPIDKIRQELKVEQKKSRSNNQPANV